MLKAWAGRATGVPEGYVFPGGRRFSALSVPTRLAQGTGSMIWGGGAAVELFQTSIKMAVEGAILA